jgi:F-type H+-transporting ATPase subunit b
MVIWFLVLKPLTKKMAERQDKITESLIKAEEIDSNLRRSEVKYQEKIDEAKSEAAKIMEKSHTEAKLIGEKIKEKSKQEIEILVDQAKKNIQIEKDETILEIKKQAGELVSMALEKILEEKIDDKKDKELILRSVKNIKI